MSVYQVYWTKNPILVSSMYHQTLSYRQFLLQKSYLIFQTMQYMIHKTFKLNSWRRTRYGPILEHLKRKFKIICTPEKYVTIDESLMYMWTGVYTVYAIEESKVQNQDLCFGIIKVHMCSLWLYIQEKAQNLISIIRTYCTQRKLWWLVKFLLNKKGYCLTVFLYFLIFGAPDW